MNEVPMKPVACDRCWTYIKDKRDWWKIYGKNFHKECYQEFKKQKDKETRAAK